jgi:two-component system cell cycle sensor histidine kinase/response regulator CckA
VHWVRIASAVDREAGSPYIVGDRTPDDCRDNLDSGLRPIRARATALHCRFDTLGHSRSLPEGLDLVSVIEHATDAIGFDDADGRIVYANRAFRRLFGIADDAELGCLDDYAAEGWSEDLRERHGARAQGRDAARSYPYLARRRDGSRFWAEVSVVPVVKDGCFSGTHAVIRDVTEQREREAALQTENHALATALDSIPLAVFVLDRNGRVQQWNDAAVQVFGWTRQEVLGRPYPLAPAELWVEHQELLARALQGVDVEGREAIRRRRDGTDVEVAVWAAAMGSGDDRDRDEGGRDGRVLEVLVDISKQRRAQQDYRQLFERAFDAIVVFEPDTECVLDVNARACQLYGRSRDEFVGMSLQSITQDVARGRAVLDRIQRDGTLHNYETVQRHKDGRELLIESNASLVEYQGRPAVLSINRDLSERRRLQQQLTHMQRMKAVGQLAAGVAHEFNNVLAAILGTAESLLDSVDEPDVRERLQQMIARAETGSRLTRQLLTFSRGGNEERTPIELDQHIRGMTKWLARLLGQDIELVLETRAPGMVVVMDPTQLEQIVLNLSVNARDVMPEGGSLRVRTRELRLSDPRQTVTGTVEPGHYVVIEFHDSGPGVPPEVQERLFEPFFSTKERGKGTGLGLATVYTIVDGVGGAIDLENHRGGGPGACFTIVLPALEREPVSVEPTLPERPVGGHETILLVDDEPTILAALGQMLRAMGYRVLMASDAVRARRVFEEARGAVDLLLTDVSMPGGSGVELAKDLLDRSPTLRVLVMSGYLDAASSEALPRTGFVDKPFTRASISRRIRELLGD